MAEREVRELKALWEIARLSSKTVGINRILAVITEKAAKLLRGDASSLRLVRGENKLELLAGYNLSEKYKSSTPLEIGKGLVGKVAQQKRALFSNDISKDPRILYPEAGKEEEIRSLVSTPLLSKGKLWGTLTVYKKRPRAFSAKEIHLLQVLAEQAALTIERATLLEELKEKVIHDELTGLHSRGYFLSRAKEELARALREKQSASFLFLDVDDFKAVNRLHGYNEGDKILCQVARTIVSSVRKEDVVCRYGGDEFGVLLSGKSSLDAVRVSERIHEKLSRVAKEGGTYPTLSVGVVSYPEHGDYLEDIIGKADISAVFAKYHIGKRTVVWGEWEKTEIKDVYTQDILPEVVYALANVVDQKNGYTSEHSKLVSQQASLIAQKMGIQRKKIDIIKTAGLLHDIGKLSIPTHILNKPSALTEEEKEIIKKHPKESEKILKRIKGFESVVSLVRAVHERWDGRGYPEGLKGEEIPLGARILAVVDTYSAMCSDRPYRKRLSPRKAIEQIRKQSASQFDPKVVQAFLDVIDAKVSKNKKRQRK
jgi:diguanylate cyclase (GGDEF)-like protein/putative nucleotidyltransferase with HDIG domain